MLEPVHQTDSNTRSGLVFVLLMIAGLLAPGQYPLTASETTELAAKALIKKGRARGQGCTRCHGRYGIQKAAELADMKASVGLFAQQELLAFKTGTRSHPIMSAVSKTLSDEDIQAIAAWLDSIR